MNKVKKFGDSGMENNTEIDAEKNEFWKYEQNWSL
jgi:hypothetical protein